MILANSPAHVNQPAVIRAYADFCQHAIDEAVNAGHDEYDDLWWLGYTVMYHETAYDETPVAPAGLTGRKLDAFLDGVEFGRLQHMADIDAWADEFEPKDYRWEDEMTAGFTGHSADESECW